MSDESKPGYRTTEYYGPPAAGALILAGISVITTMAGTLGPSMAVWAGLVLVVSGAAIQVAYALMRMSFKKTKLNGPKVAEAVSAAVADVLPGIVAEVAAKRQTKKEAK